MALYAQRWDRELRYRDIKTSLAMDEFDVRSVAMFQRELEVGLLTYNLISALLGRAARHASVPLAQLSFTSCLRCIRHTLTLGIPDWVLQRYPQPLDWLVERMAKCTLPSRRRKIAHEPRAVRRRPQVFPALKGTRPEARKMLAETAAAVAAAANS